jgi:Family of unknown function (DUF5908)
VPLEINEIAIQMQVQQEGSPAEPSETSASGFSKSGVPAGRGEFELERTEIVEDCVRRVLQVLKSVRER